MRLVIFHYHYRPGGVRRVIELALPHLVGRLRPRIDSVVLAGGEVPDSHWKEYLTKQLGRMSVELPTDPSLGYLSESGSSAREIKAGARRAVRGILDGADGSNCIVWAHNLGLARNPLMARAIAEETAARGITLIAHHHDWWFDNRWQRWPEMRRAGIGTLKQAAGAALPARPNIRHVTINQTDFDVLRRHFGKSARWVPNMIESRSKPSADRVKAARIWLAEQVGEDAPVWMLPCRLLRRKNVAESLLLTRWLRPGGWLVTTGGASSADESAYAEALSNAARENGWKLKLGVLQGGEVGKPSVPELLRASEAVILTSIQEGFGLPFLEATAAGRPLIARRLPNVFPDLARFGFRFSQAYDELMILPDLFDWNAERRRQMERFREWKGRLPSACRKWAGRPILLAGGRRPVPFSRLTLRAQLEALAHGAEDSWRLCAPLNPFLRKWKALAGQGSLKANVWPAKAEQWLGGEGYARRIQEAIESKDTGRRASSVVAQGDFVRQRLLASNLYPLLWNTNP